MRQTNGDRKSKMNQVKWLQNTYSCELCSGFFCNDQLRNVQFDLYKTWSFDCPLFVVRFLFSFVPIIYWKYLRKPHGMPWSIQVEVTNERERNVFNFQRKKSGLFSIVETNGLLLKTFKLKILSKWSILIIINYNYHYYLTMSRNELLFNQFGRFREKKKKQRKKNKTLMRPWFSLSFIFNSLLFSFALGHKDNNQKSNKTHRMLLTPFIEKNNDVYPFTCRSEWKI